MKLVGYFYHAGPAIAKFGHIGYNRVYSLNFGHLALATPKYERSP
ncbi:hypothetical protein [Aerosakkonema funiforme]|nr:hypothetical protein [Aerosakkonema funiforme]